MVDKIHIFVCIKQVPAVPEVKIDPKTNTLIREGIPSIINPLDKNALELALSLKEKHGAEVIALSMGPLQAEEVLREALAMGADQAYLITDKLFAGADTLATSYTLSIVIKKILKDLKNKDKFLVFCGAHAIDGDTAQVGSMVAEELGIPQITYVQNFELKEDIIIVQRAFRKEEVVIIESKLPSLISVLKEINIPRYPTMLGIMKAYDKKKITYLDSKAINAKENKIGLKGSLTEVWKIFIPKRKGEQIILEGTNEEIAQKLWTNLKNDNII